jgi:PAS domain-containing protein
VRYIRSIVESIRNKDGAVVRLAGASQDVTEQVKATELLRESEARLKRAERITHVGNWALDIKANRLSWSEEVFRIEQITVMVMPGIALDYADLLDSFLESVDYVSRRQGALSGRHPLP